MSWMDNIRQVTPYIPGEQPKDTGIVKLNTNENPYPPSPKVISAIEHFNGESLRKYSDPNVTDLRDAIAAYHKVKRDNVFVGVGSDDVLAMSFLTFFNSNKPVVFPNITYSFYEVWAKLYNIPYELKPLNSDFSLNSGDYVRDNGGVVIANPNAPTGLAMDVDGIARLPYLNPDSVVIVDEAYVDFYGQSAISLVGKYDNLLVVRTFSKSRSLAGQRIGYAVGSKKLIDSLFAVRNSFNSYTIDSITSAVGIASIEDEEYFQEHLRLIIDTREWFKNEMMELGFTFPDSSANFIFAKHERESAKNLLQMLRDQNIYVRHFDKPGISDYLRITIGTNQEMERLLNEIRGMV